MVGNTGIGDRTLREGTIAIRERRAGSGYWKHVEALVESLQPSVPEE